MDSTGCGEGQEEPSEQPLYSSISSKGRQRKKNLKYLDYETDDTAICESILQKSPKNKSEKEDAVPQKSSRRGRKPKAAVKQTGDGDKESKDKILVPPDSVSKTVEVPVTPKKRGRKKKVPVVPDGELPVEECGGGGAENSVNQENGTPKPQCEKEPEEEAESGRHRRRGAAKLALKYLQLLAKDLLSHPSEEAASKPHANNEDVSEHNGPQKRRGRKRKRLDSDSGEDEDFVPNDDEEADEMEDEFEENEDSDSDSDFEAHMRRPAVVHVNRHTSSDTKPINGVDFNIIQTIWDSSETTKKFREENYTSWVFPEWVPSTKEWDPVPESDLEKYLPQETQSAAFKVSREALSKEETPELRLSRFKSVPAHNDRWDMFLFTGGPLWAAEWCPTPDGAPATQYVALACHQGMDDSHLVNQTYEEPGLVQLWDCGKLEYDKRSSGRVPPQTEEVFWIKDEMFQQRRIHPEDLTQPDSQPVLVYGLAQDKGFIWQMKWCPAGGWESPSCGRKTPFLPRLGLLAVAASSGVVTIYSLPHPEALLSNKKPLNSEKDPEKLPIYKVRGVVTLKLGSIKAPREGRSGQVLTMDWLPQKPHNIMAIGFYDGVVGLWDLSTKSALLRVRESDRSLTLLPYRCILAHNHSVRALAFCPASRHLLTTAGDDRYVKMWDLRRLFEPVRVQKRYLTNEICWPLHASGIMMAKETAFVPTTSLGVHFLDHNMNAFFAVPRSTPVWSISYSEWLNCALTADLLGEVILVMLPPLNSSIHNVKRISLRRFPAYVTSKVRCDAAEVEPEEMQDAEAEGHVDEGQEGGETEKADAATEGGNEEEAGSVENETSPQGQFQTYKEAVEKYYLQYSDFNMRTLVGLGKRTLWKQMQRTETTEIPNMEEKSLTALHKVRFNPNMSSHVWLVSGGQSGLVRLHCLRTMITPHVKKMISVHQVQFSALYSPQDQTAVQTAEEQL